jgi:hypothetical protein
MALVLFAACVESKDRGREKTNGNMGGNGALLCASAWVAVF